MCPSGKLRTEFTRPIAKSTSPGLSDTTYFAHCTVEPLFKKEGKCLLNRGVLMNKSWAGGC